ncbi:MAG: hypothetical protein CMM32_05415 [Rhodospirillaceae bacterium]|nr:hypothetical protein [Rhodospirillaceae bacterium]MBT06340.1 hypothetical protein [Rhodospirillaceae bacterium]
MKQPDVLFMGYSKAGSTFLQKFFQTHPQVFIDRIAARHLFSPSRVTFSEKERRQAGQAKLYISMQERLCESVIYKKPELWPQLKWESVPWNDLSKAIDIAPRKIASAWRTRFPNSKVLMVVRDQVTWLSSAYSYYLDHLQPGHRSFIDFCSTSKGKVLLRAGHYDLTIQAYIDEFGPENVKVLSFTQLSENRTDFLRELCEFFDLSPMPFTAPPQNSGRSKTAAKILKHLPRWAPDTPSLRKLGKQLVPLLGSKSKYTLSSEEKRFVQSFYDLSNLRMMQLLSGAKSFKL